MEARRRLSFLYPHQAKLFPLLGQISRALRGIVMIFLVIRTLPPVEYGSYDLLLGLIALSAAFSVGLLAQGTIRFVSFYRDNPTTQRAVLELVFALTLLAGFLAGTLVWLLRPWIASWLRFPAFLDWAWLLALTVLLQGLRGLALHTLQGQERYGRLLSVELVLNGGFVFGVLLLWRGNVLGLSSLLWIFLATEAASLLVSWLLARPWLPSRPRWHAEHFRAFWSFSGYLALYMLALHGGQYADVILISAYLSPEQVGFYSAVKRLTDTIALVFLNAINTVTLPRSAYLYQRRDWPGLRRLKRRALGYGLLLLGPAGMACMLAPEAILEALYRGAYTASAPILRTLGAGFPAEVFYLVGLNLLMGIGHVAPVFRAQLMRLGLSTTLYLILIPAWGERGAAMANVLAASAAALYVQWMLYRIWTGR
jgi:O-antigen/teichoic acid export membrane protein|nr:MAG: hypothetical protein KatS3mg041_0324 [Bacteroidota bacterium]